ncbi:hypothetical protein BDL97_15G054100 [Sphagnum fallax]|nr:hypothetical protein BDL97_15G054100 [Sphagnum fallax]
MATMAVVSRCNKITLLVTQQNPPFRLLCDHRNAPGELSIRSSDWRSTVDENYYPLLRLHDTVCNNLSLYRTPQKRKLSSIVRANAREREKQAEVTKKDGPPLFGSEDLKLPPAPRMSDQERERRRKIEDELKDSRNFIDYLAPRPIRRILFGAGAASCLLGSCIALAKLLADPSFEMATGSANNVGIDLLGCITFSSLFLWEGQEAEARIEKRKELRATQIRLGDREVYVSKTGEKMSRLKPVDDEWILRRLDRWGAQDFLPQIGPKKGALIQGLIKEHSPKLIVEVGTFMGYSAITMAQAALPTAHIVTFEKDFKWMLVAKRFTWQAKMSDKIEVRWGDATTQLQKLREPIDFLLLDAKPSEYLDYLKAAEPLLSPGSIIVADNAGVFKTAMQPYLDYVRHSGKYSSQLIETTLEYQDHVPDGLEVSTFLN